MRTAAVLAPDTPDHRLGSTNDVSALLGDSINQLRRGQLDPRVANAIGYLASILLRAIEQGSGSSCLDNDAAGGVKGGVYMSLFARMAQASGKQLTLLEAHQNPESKASPLFPETPAAKPVAPVPTGIPAPGESIDEPTEPKAKPFAEQRVITIEVE